MSRHLFTSDLHLGHERVAALRGFLSVKEHDDHVLGVLWATVREGDVLWVLGDLVGSSRGWETALGHLAALPCRKRLVLGNHDPAHPMNRHAWRHTARLAEVVEWFGPMAQTRLGGRDVVLSHFPYSRDRAEARYLQWRPRNEGAWLLHGHTHGPERLTWRNGWGPSRTPDGKPEREVHVGFDAWGRPVADHEVADLISQAGV